MHDAYVFFYHAGYEPGLKYWKIHCFFLCHTQEGVYSSIFIIRECNTAHLRGKSLYFPFSKLFIQFVQFPKSLSDLLKWYTKLAGIFNHFYVNFNFAYHLSKSLNFFGEWLNCIKSLHNGKYKLFSIKWAVLHSQMIKNWWIYTFLSVTQEKTMDFPIF